MTMPVHDGDGSGDNGRKHADGDGVTPLATLLTTLSGGVAEKVVILRDEDGLSTSAPAAGMGSAERRRTTQLFEGPTAAGDEATEGAGPLRYELLDELGRGGMGMVVRARDRDLGRDVALKVLLEARRDEPELVRRFVEEAQICGQLQHPGVVPVHELGRLADLRPYFTMRLVKGETLGALLKARPDPGHDRPRFLGIFEAVCQTVAYAHARGVIHRDLKPANVMVGTFGVVQVMDWGLAKVLPRDGVAEEPAETPADLSVIMTDRGDSGEFASRAGSVMGTPAYMAPEQARGEVQQVDERADVFGLGAILCDLLTGAPAFVGRTAAETHRKAALGDTTDALARLSSCDADPELLALARDCLAPERDDRTRDAGAVADRMTAYLAGVQERLRASELERAAAQARAEEEVKRRALADSLAQEARARAASEARRRRTTVALAASILALVVFGGAAGSWYVQQRRDRQLRVDLAFADVERLRKLAAADPDGDVSKWHAAQESLKHVDDLLSGLADPRASARFASLRADLAAATAAAEADRKLVDALDEIRTDDFEKAQWDRVDADYAAAFRGAGLDIDGKASEVIGAVIAQRPPNIALAIASALDDWARLRRVLRLPESDWTRLLAAARASDVDPWRRGLRDALARSDTVALRRLADSTSLDHQPAASLVLLALNLDTLHDDARVRTVLNAGSRAHPADFWTHMTRANIAHNAMPPRHEEAVRHYTAALALRPNSAAAHNNLGTALDGLEKSSEAISEYRKAIWLRPDYPEAHVNLGNALADRGKPAEAAAEYREALRLRPELPVAHLDLGVLLRTQGRPGEAVAEVREALRLRPNYPEAHLQLGTALRELGRTAEAMSEFREALLLRPDYAVAHHSLGLVLRTVGKPTEAVAEYREALRLQPDDPEVHHNLGLALHALGKPAEAAAELKEALRLRPAFPEAHCGLGLVFQAQGRFPEALAELRRGHEFGSKRAGWSIPSAALVKEAERLVALEERLAAVLKGNDRPKDAAERSEFAAMAYNKGLNAGATRLYESAFMAEPTLVDYLAARHRYNAACAAALAGCGEGKDDPAPDDVARARLRAKALDWLKADLAAWRLRPAAEAPRVVEVLRHWQIDPDLAGVREPEALEKLPEEERRAWRALSDEVAATLKELEPASKDAGAGAEP